MAKLRCVASKDLPILHWNKGTNYLSWLILILPPFTGYTMLWILFALGIYVGT